MLAVTTAATVMVEPSLVLNPGPLGRQELNARGFSFPFFKM